MLAQTLILWSHALAALLFGLLAAAQWRRRGHGPARWRLCAGLAATALWALAVAGIAPQDGVTRVALAVRDLAWLGFMHALARGSGRTQGRSGQRMAVGAVYGVVVAIVLAALALGLAQVSTASGEPARLLGQSRMILWMMVALSALILLHHLHGAAAAGRAGLRIAVFALAVMWSIDLVLAATAYMTDAWLPALLAGRGIALVLLAPLFAVAAQGNGDWTLQLSRTVAFRSLGAVGVALYLGATLLVTAAVGAFGGPHGRVAQTAFVFGSTAAILTIASSPWLRAWVRVIVAKHLFRHRYDYRAEWLRFTDTLGLPGDAAAPLATRIVKAVADLTESPGGVLLVAEGAGLEVVASVGWDTAVLPALGGDEGLRHYLDVSERILELDAVRRGAAPADDAAAVPAWMLACPEAWVVVPLCHFGQLAGAILLARPLIDRALDWEDFDLLRIAGRQVASYLAEDRAHDALAEARRFDEFNRRFAFILHDIKNLVSQLSLVARNAERHADNPDFRRDMVATLQDSAERMTALVARLSQAEPARGEPLQPVDVAALAERIARARRAQHPVAAASEGRPLAMADPARLEQLLSHLVQNAVEASPADQPVTLSVTAAAGTVAVEVIDHGCGMAPAFVRDQLFRPFASSKPGGFGVGAFEARQLAQAMGGGVEVWSREGEGTRFRIVLPAAADRWEKAA